MYVWYGMVWYGMVWYGMVWYGMVWYGMYVCMFVYICTLCPNPTVALVTVIFLLISWYMPREDGEFMFMFFPCLMKGSAACWSFATIGLSSSWYHLVSGSPLSEDIVTQKRVRRAVWLSGASGAFDNLIPFDRIDFRSWTQSVWQFGSSHGGLCRLRLDHAMADRCCSPKPKL